MEQQSARPEQAPRPSPAPPSPPAPPAAAPPPPADPVDSPKPRPAATSAAAPASATSAPRPAPPARLPHPPHQQRQPQSRPGPRPASKAARTRYTAMGVGVVMCVASVCAGVLDALALNGPGTFFGVVFILTCFYAAARVRSSDLAAAPISAPIAFALTLVLTSPSSGDGLSGRVIGVITGLATHAGWLYAGTLTAGGLAGLRYFTLRSQRPY